MKQQIDKVYIEAMAACVPSNRVTNDLFSNLLSPKDLRRFEKTVGIKERRYADKNTTASDLAFHAAEKVLENIADKSKIKVLIFLSQTPDYKIPFTSNILQDRLGLSSDTLCLDVNAGCAGFIQGLSTAFSMANTVDGKVLFVVAETLSKILSYKDRGTTMLFGDGAAALLIEKNENDTSKTVFNFFSDGSNADAIIVPDGGYRNPFNKDSLEWKADDEQNQNKSIHLKMDGPRVFDFTLREIPGSIEQLLEDFQIQKDNVDTFLFHQSNQFIIKQISGRLNIPKSKVPLNIDQFGNTSGVSIPILMVTNLDKSNLPQNVVMSGYGAGLSWGNCYMTIKPDITIHDIIEI
jgi:3-oxoacyl-[acyl-carrier-protein] synthase-3